MCIEKCEELTAIDGRCMDDIVKGRGIKETFAEHRGKFLTQNTNTISPTLHNVNNVLTVLIKGKK